MLFAEAVYHTQETVLKTRNATQSAPLSSPSCVSSKDHLLAAHESLKGENRALLCRDTRSPSISARRLFLMTGLFRLQIWWGWRAVPSVSVEVSHLSLMSGKLIFQRVTSTRCRCYYLRLSWFFSGSISENIQSVNPNCDTQVQTRKWLALFFFFFLIAWFPRRKEKSPGSCSHSRNIPPTSFLAIWSSKCS